MAFTDKDGNIVTKQHLNLSRTAYDAVVSDMFTFESDQRSNVINSGLINRIFANYYEDANASISRRLNEYREDLTRTLAGIREDGTVRKIVKRLVNKEKERLLENSSQYGNYKAFKFTVNRKNYEYLTEPESECEEDAFYKSRGKYIKCVIEEYARRPFSERERIYYKDRVDTINYAIQEKKRLRIATADGAVYSVYPYRILQDPQNTANYLAGYSLPYGSDEEELSPCSFRIAALRDVKAEKTKSAFLKMSEWKRLETEINSRGIQFLLGNVTEIVVKLTDTGLHKYQRMASLRPVFAERRSDHVFMFACTKVQAEYYFFKFGDDAEILQPQSLRDEFQKRYQSAARVYNSAEQS